MITVKKFLAMLVVATMILTLWGCGGNDSKQPISNLANPLTDISDDTKELTPEEEEAKKDFANSTPQNDTDIGLKIIKVDTAEMELSQEQIRVIKYFDNDYFEISDYEFLRRYPQVFDDAQVTVSGTVKKVISQKGNSYEAVFWIGSQWTDEDQSELVLIKGEITKALYIEGDNLRIYGRYVGVETISVDGTSMTVPIIDVYDAYMCTVENRFDFVFVKAVAKSVFGDDIEVRKIDRDPNYGIDAFACYEVVLDNQSNAKMSKFLLDITYGTGSIGCVDTAPTIERYVEFSGDLQTFYVVSYDWGVGTFTIECYNHQIEKIWKREYEEIQPPETEGLMDRLYDYTKNNFYLVLNNELHIINAKTGEDTFSPAYIGDKVAVRKLSDGILVVASGKSDTIMKLDLTGRMIWKTNTTSNVWNVMQVQANRDNLVIHTSNDDGYHYYVLASQTGQIIVDAIELQ